MPSFRRVLTSIFQTIANRMIRPRDLSEGSFGNCHYQYAKLDLPKQLVCQVVIDLPAGIGGQLQIVPVDKHEALWDNSRSLESIDFNQRIKVHASSKALAFKVLAPDCMAWLLDLSQMPQIYVLEKQCFVAFLDGISTKDYQLATAEKILTFILRSGALEKNS